MFDIFRFNLGAVRCEAGAAWSLAARLKRLRATEREIDGQYAYGWRFGLGFFAAASVFSVIWLVIAVAIGNAVANEQLRAIKAVSRSFSVPSVAPQRLRTSRTVMVDPESKEVCFERTDGVINEEFRRCVTGYSKTVTE